jgi:hypothetical protein
MNQEAKIKRLEKKIKDFEVTIYQKDDEIKQLKNWLTQERSWRKLFQSLIKEAAQEDDLKTEGWGHW